MLSSLVPPGSAFAAFLAAPELKEDQDPDT